MRSGRIILLIAIALLLIGFVIGMSALRWFGRTPEQLSWLGGFLSGTVGPLWSVASLLLVYVAYLAQRQQLSLQEHEIRESSKVQERNRIETQYFQLLRRFQDVLDSLEHSVTLGERDSKIHLSYRGKRLLHNVLHTFRERAGDLLRDGKCEETEALRKALDAATEPSTADFSAPIAILGALLRLAKRIKRDDPLLADDLIDITFGQLSDSELQFVFYYCALKSDQAALKELIERLGGLCTLRSAALIVDRHRSLFTESAYLRAA